jgi:hypothetical protein
MALNKSYILTIMLWALIAAAPSAWAKPPEPPAGPTTAPQTCDPDYWQSMSAKAWMEAEREIIQNKNLIYKPDSVMEYVCFDSFMMHSAKYVGDIFTHTKYFDGQEIIPRGKKDISLEYTLTSAVTDSLKTYLTNNFSHTFFGDRAKHMVTSTSDYAPGDASAMGKYACGIMRNVWATAKCENFIDNSEFDDNDGFYPFETLKPGPGGKKEIKGYKEITDPRQFPTQCPSPSNPKWKWDVSIPEAKNTPGTAGVSGLYTASAGGGASDLLYKFKEPNKKTYDDIRPKLEPGSCTTAIKTGVTVITETGGTTGYLDGVCSNPGCAFQKAGTCAQ